LSRWNYGVALGLLSASILVCLFQFLNLDRSILPAMQGVRSDLPNIIFFASDGVEAESLSAYFFDQDTSPHLKEFSADTLFFENAIPNGNSSFSSVSSMLIGKHPQTTNLMNAGNALTGEMALEHLPAILTGLGYRNYQFAHGTYIDGPQINMMNSFVFANGRHLSVDATVGNFQKTFTDEIFFLRKIMQRISDRAKHLTLIEPMNNDFLQVTGSDQKGSYTDRMRIRGAKERINGSRRPFFLHIHLMGTHLRRAKARGLNENRYENLVRRSDGYFHELTEALKEEGIFDETLIVYYSDHGLVHRLFRRVPLIIRFPKGEHEGRVQETVQLLDVAPTILDYLGVPKPPWMEGESLLSPLTGNRTFFSFVTARTRNMKRAARPETTFPGRVGIHVCNHWAQVEGETGEVSIGTLPGHTKPCGERSPFTDAKAREMAYQFFAARGQLKK
jgi:arylsulfatase A-like enzyme